MFGASSFTLLRRQQAKKQEQKEEKKKSNILHYLEEVEMNDIESDSDSSVCEDLNVFVVTFQKMKEAEKNLAGGDPYQCKFCEAYFNSFSKLIPSDQLK